MRHTKREGYVKVPGAPFLDTARFPDTLLVPTRDGDLTCTCSMRDVPFTRRAPDTRCDIFTFKATGGTVPTLKLKHDLLRAQAPVRVLERLSRSIARGGGGGGGGGIVAGRS